MTTSALRARLSPDALALAHQLGSARLLELAAERRRVHPYLPGGPGVPAELDRGGLWRPHPHDAWMEEAARDPQVRTIVLAGANRGGKTALGSRLAVRAMLGELAPRLRCPLRVIFGTSTLDLSRNKQQREVATWLPPEKIAEGAYTPERGWTHNMVRLKCGCEGHFLSYRSSGGETLVGAFESREADMMVLDEPMPQEVYRAAASRLAKSTDLMVVTMTLLMGRRSWWYETFIKPWHEEGKTVPIRGRRLTFRDNPLWTGDDEAAARSRMTGFWAGVRIDGEFRDLSAEDAVCGRALAVMSRDQLWHGVSPPAAEPAETYVARLREVLEGLPGRDLAQAFGTAAYVDWARAQASTGSRFAVAVVGLAPQRSWLLEGIAGHLSSEERIDAVLRAHLRWRPDVLCFETVGAQEEFMSRFLDRVRDLIERGEMRSDEQPHVRAVTPRTEKRLRIESNLVLEMEQGRFRCRRDDPVLDEAATWEGSKDGCDLLDAVAGAIEHGRGLVSGPPAMVRQETLGMPVRTGAGGGARERMRGRFGR